MRVYGFVMRNPKGNYELSWALGKEPKKPSSKEGSVVLEHNGEYDSTADFKAVIVEMCKARGIPYGG